LIERMSIKKATSTRSVMVESFGLDQFVGKSAQCNGADNPKSFGHAFVVFCRELCGSVRTYG
jgi:hypothetical protein